MSKDETLAKPPAECCLEASIHTGEAKGSMSTVIDIPSYITKPSQGKDNGNIVLYFPDVYGMFINAFLVMDGYAAAGYTVFGMDYFRGDPISKYRNEKKETVPGFDFDAWRKKHSTFAKENVDKWAAAIKSEHGTATTKYACVGYCFGAPYVCEQLAGDLCSVGAFAHPGSLQESHFRNLKAPLFLSCAETDHTFPTERRNKAVDIMVEEGKKYHVQLFQGVAHGFAIKGNNEVPYERWCKETSLKGIIGWFDFWLGQ